MRARIVFSSSRDTVIQVQYALQLRLAAHRGAAAASAVVVHIVFLEQFVTHAVRALSPPPCERFHLSGVDTAPGR